MKTSTSGQKFLYSLCMSDTRLWLYVRYFHSERIYQYDIGGIFALTKDTINYWSEKVEEDTFIPMAAGQYYRNL